MKEFSTMFAQAIHDTLWELSKELDKLRAEGKNDMASLIVISAKQYSYNSLRLLAENLRKQL